jgi:hypothetical protein
VFGITVEGTAVRTGLDLITEFGHRSGGMLSYPVTVTDGVLNVGFSHGTENPLVNAIEIVAVPNTAIQLKASITGNIEIFNEVMLYPNPVNQGGILIATIPELGDTKMVSFEIYSVMGSKVMERRYQGVRSGTLELDIDNGMAAGVYIVRIAVDEQVVKTQKLIVR